jgi:hypothetical protein
MQSYSLELYLSCADQQIENSITFETHNSFFKKDILTQEKARISIEEMYKVFLGMK